MKYLVQYTLPYDHRVVVGIEADDPEAAVARAQALFDSGDIWQDTDQVPLLYDDYEETGERSLTFTVERTLEACETWPEPDDSVLQLRRIAAAMDAARCLVRAFGDDGGIQDLNEAYEAALKAV